MSERLPEQSQPILPSRPEQGRALIVVLAVMATLAALALLFSRGADRLEHDWSAQLSESSTVQVMVASETLRAAQMSAVEAALRDTLPEARINVLESDELDALLRPWLGDAPLPDDLPVPGLIRVNSRAALPVESLQRRLEGDGIRIVVDDHSRFSGSLSRTVGRLVLLGIGLVIATLGAALAVSLFATRAGLSAQRDIIHVLVQAGASDSFIARLFIGASARRGTVGGALGCAVAAGLWLIISIGPGRGTVGWSGALDGIIDIILLVALALCFGVVCAGAAGWAATRQLTDERKRL